MKMNKSLLYVLLVVIVFAGSGCKKEKPEPYIYFKDDTGKEIISDTIYVNLNSEYKLFVEVGYQEKGLIHYMRQFDTGIILDLYFTDDLRITTIGIDNGLRIEKAVIRTSFTSDVVQSGSVVKITVNDTSNQTKKLVYKVR